MRILALDVGEKNIGLAISDELGWTAQGLTVIRRQNKDQDISTIGRLVQENNISEIVVGMPLDMNGAPGKSAQGVAAFIEDLKKRLKNSAIKAWDERLSSLQAEKAMLAADLSRKKRKKRIDVLAAQLILQSYLDARSKPSDV